MTEIIKKHWNIVLIVGIGLSLAIIGIVAISGMIFLDPGIASATITHPVTVTATVAEWLTFTVSPTSTTLTPDLVSAAGVPAIGSSTVITLTLGTNSADGWSINIHGANNGLFLTAADLIDSVALAATATLAAGTDGYGANATGTFSGVTVGPFYANWETNTVGAIRTTAQRLASRTTGNAATGVANMRIRAACDTTQEAGTYSDTITLTGMPSIP